MLRIDWKETGRPVLDRLGRQFVSVAKSARGGSYARRQVKYNTYLIFLRFLGGALRPGRDPQYPAPACGGVYQAFTRSGEIGQEDAGLSLDHPLVARTDPLAEVRTARKQNHL